MIARDPVALHRFLAFDPARNEYLVLANAGVAGMPVWLVERGYRDRAEAEHQAGLHATPALAWLLHGLARGWRLANGQGWLSEPGPRCHMTESQARAALAAAPALVLFVWRSGRGVTCPDWRPESQAA